MNEEREGQQAKRVDEIGEANSDDRSSCERMKGETEMVTSRGEKAVAAGGREGPTTRSPVLPTSLVTDVDTQRSRVDSFGHTSSVFTTPMGCIIHVFLTGAPSQLPVCNELVKLV
ncbi:unnamed protein product [Hydatigera taeniaeformis]|uniref:Uncharacterized protein n=1 Tax=Hydatigena taeniaeformis TaxID=6205 RepID=A0A0R3WVC6_HYDTA|nr:unnamed protein product [Hydatigera taeniaeformis]